MENKVTDVAIRNARHMADALAHQINLTLQQIEEMRAQVEAWRSQKDEIDDFIRQWDLFAHHPLEASALHLSGLSGQQGSRRLRLQAKHEAAHVYDASSSTNSKKEEVARLSRRIIETTGRPVSKQELLHRLREHGIVIRGSDPEAVLNTMLWRTRDEPTLGVVYVRNAGYWLREVPNRSIGYHPEHSRTMLE